MSLGRLLLFAALVAAAGSTLAADAGEGKLRQVMEQARLRAAAPQGSQAPAVGPERSRERLALLAGGEAALAKADVEGALRDFDRAASIQHAADTEMGLVRAYMQGGEYRRAVAFVAHTASAHRDVAGGAALYAWLLHIGGQVVPAQRLLAEARERFQGEANLGEVQRQFLSGKPLAAGALLEAPARLAPYGPAALPKGARVVGSGWLFDGGRRVLAPVATLAGASTAWVRNGLGDTSRARVESRDPNSRLAILRLEHALPVAVPDTLAARDPFPGSVAFAVEYVESGDAAPRWPVLRSGFLGSPGPDGKGRRLGVEMPSGPRGGPVFDSGGKVVGIALPGPRGQDQLLPVSELRRAMAEPGAVSPGPAIGPPVSADSIYESALRSAVQVIAAR